MAKFIAKDADPLEFDMRPYYEAHGFVPEPSNDLVAEFYANLGTTLKDALGDERTEGVDLTVPEQVGKLYMSLTADDHRAMYGQMLDVYAKVLDGQPSRECLEALPYRIRQAFYGAVQGWLRPEA